jgi:hypothetical protein
MVRLADTAWQKIMIAGRRRCYSGVVPTLAPVGMKTNAGVLDFSSNLCAENHEHLFVFPSWSRTNLTPKNSDSISLAQAYLPHLHGFQRFAHAYESGSGYRQVLAECPRAHKSSRDLTEKFPMFNSHSHNAHRAARRRSVGAEKASTTELYSNPRLRRLWRLMPAALLGCGAIFGAVPPAASTDIPNFMGDRNTAWLPDRPTGDDFLPPPNGPGPVMSSKDRPYCPNGTGRQPTGSLILAIQS